MTRLIDAEALKKEFKKIYHCAETMEELANTMEDAIDNAPTFEDRDLFNMGYFEGKKIARPKGKWIMNKTSARGRNYTCTRCEKVSRNKFHFCPNCGADMRQKEADNEKGVSLAKHSWVYTKIKEVDNEES